MFVFMGVFKEGNPNKPNTQGEREIEMNVEDSRRELRKGHQPGNPQQKLQPCDLPGPETKLIRCEALKRLVCYPCKCLSPCSAALRPRRPLCLSGSYSHRLCEWPLCFSF